MAAVTRGIKKLFKRKSNASKNDISNAANESGIDSAVPPSTSALDIPTPGDMAIPPSEPQRQSDTPAAVLDTATKTFHGMKLAPGVLKESSSNINSLEKGVDLSISSLLNTLKTFNVISEKLSAIHPYVQAACTVLSGISKIITDQADRDRSVQNLLDTMTDLYMVLNNEKLEDIESMKSVVQCICQQTLECSYFIEGYAKDQKFHTRVAKNTLSRTDDRVVQYQNAFLELRQGFETRASLETLLAGRETLLVVHRIWEKMDTLDDIARRVDLSSMPYPSGVGLNLSKVCLEGTRQEVLDEITEWALSTDTATPRVFWLHGNAGTGKSAIAHTIAHRLKTIKRLGSCFCFDRSALAEKRHEAIFSTIAQDLSSLDEGMRRVLSATIVRDVSLRNTTDIIQQWKEFILKPAKIVSDALSGPIIIVIDALDESGDPDSRELLLKILAGRMADIDDQIHQLPANIRILLTSRPLPDINDSLHDLAHIHQKSMDSISNESTETDIRSFINSKLAWSGVQQLEEEKVYALATVSGGLFEWARLACAYIDKRNQGGLTPKERFERIVARARDARDYLLDDMYKITLEAILPEDADDVDTFLVRFRSTMAQIIGTAEPMTVASLKAMRKFFPNEQCGINVETIVLPMGALLTGTTGASAVRPLHASFTDFLTHKGRSKDFFVDLSSIHEELAFACLGLMEGSLRFNACNLLSSYLANSEVPNLVERVKQNISVELSYSCRFWTLHLHHAKVTEPLVEVVRAFFGHERLLFWIEVLSLLKKISTCPSALARVMEWANLPGLESSNGINDLPSSCPDLGDSAADVQRFIRVFGGAISLSTPHLYVSALPFTPTNSSVFRKFSTCFPKVLQIIRGRRASWPVAQAVLRGHTQVVNCVAFSPDSRLIISGSDDSTIRLWDAETGEPLRSSLSGHTDWVYSVAFSADGRRFVSGSGDRTLRLWDYETGEVATLKGHKGPVTSVAFSPDGKQIASGSYDKTICLWSTETRQQLCLPLEGHGGSVMSLAFSPNGRYIVSGSNDKTVRLWDVEKKQMFHPALDGHSHCVRSVTFSPDGCLAVSGADDCTIRIWDVETKRQLGEPLTGHDKEIHSISFSRDGAKIISASGDGTIRSWSVKSRQQLGPPLEGHDKWPIKSVAFSPDGRRIVSGSWDNTVRIWDAQSAEAEPQVPQIGHDSTISSIVFSPDGKQIASGSWDKTIRLWDADTGKLLGLPLEGHEKGVECVAFSPDGKRLASGSRSDDATVRVWDVGKGQQLVPPLQGHAGYVLSMVFSPDGKLLASGSADKTIRLWKTTTWESLQPPLEGHDDWVQSVAFSLDGGQIASGSDDRTLRLWDVKEGKVHGHPPFRGHEGEVNSVIFSPNEKQVASGSYDKTIRLWSTEPGQEFGSQLKVFAGHDGAVYSVVFSSDGQQIISGSQDRTIRLWGTESGQQLRILRGHEDSIRTVAYSPVNRFIASGSNDKTIRVWDAKTESELQQHAKNFYTPEFSWTTKHFVCFSTSLNHGLRMHSNSSSSPYVEADSVDVDDHGWTHFRQDAESNRLFWTPQLYCPVWVHQYLLQVLPAPEVELDLSVMAHGSEWHLCYNSSEAGQPP